MPDQRPVPQSALSLRGRLTLEWPPWVSELSGGLRFHYMNLSGGMDVRRFLLDACAETLETFACLPPGLHR